MPRGAAVVEEQSAVSALSGLGEDRAMKLYVIRHAWAADRGAYPTDAERPLTEEGAKRFSKFARKLVKRGVSPEIVATSPLLRCRQTAEILCDRLGKGSSLEPLDALAPDSDLEKLAAWLSGRRDKVSAVAWVGHAPDVTIITAHWIGGGTLWFPKGAAACISFDFEIEPSKGELDWLVTPKLLKC